MPYFAFFLHPPRDDFAATMTDEEKEAWGVHFERLQRLLRDGKLVLAGPTLGSKNIGIGILECDDEAEARRLVDEDPTVARGFARGEVLPFHLSLLRGRDEG